MEFNTFLDYFFRETGKLLSHHDDPSHDIIHIRKVWDHTKEAIKFVELGEYRNFCLEAAAILHDVDDTKVQKENTEHAKRILEDKLEFSMVKDILEIISLVSTRDNLNSEVSEEDRWKLIVRDCDRLEAIGEIGILRCYQYTLKIKRPLFDEETPRFTSLEEMYSKTQGRFEVYKGKSRTMMDHYYDKLIYIGKVCSGNEYCRIESEKRMKIITNFALEFGRTGKVNF